MKEGGGRFARVGVVANGLFIHACARPKGQGWCGVRSGHTIYLASYLPHMYLLRVKAGTLGMNRLCVNRIPRKQSFPQHIVWLLVSRTHSTARFPSPSPFAWRNNIAVLDSSVVGWSEGGSEWG